MVITELKRLPIGATSFEANGKKFIVHRSVGFFGWASLEKLRVEIQSGAGPSDLVKANGKIVGALRKNDVYDASVIAYNATSVAERISSGRPHPLLLMVTLFARPEGSDVRYWNEDTALEWLNDFNEEGYDVVDFFVFADVLRENFEQHFQHGSLDTLLNESLESEASAKSENP